VYGNAILLTAVQTPWMVHYEPFLYTVRSSQVSESQVLVGQLHMVKQREAIDSTASQAKEPVRMCSNKEAGVAHVADTDCSIC
jgi:hypothetical protein